VNRARRRAKVRYHAEIILREAGELCAADLTSKIEGNMQYGLDSRIVGQILKDHPRITRVCTGGRLTYYRLNRAGNPQ